MQERRERVADGREAADDLVRELYCFTAAMMPIGRETTMVTMSATPISITVAGTRSKIMSRTGWLVVERIAPRRLVPGELEEGRDPLEVLLPDRSVEPVQPHQRLELFRPHTRRSEAVDGIARRELDDHEDEQRDPEHDRDRLDQAPDRVSQHPRPPSWPGFRRQVAGWRPVGDATLPYPPSVVEGPVRPARCYDFWLVSFSTSQNQVGVSIGSSPVELTVFRRPSRAMSDQA